MSTCTRVTYTRSTRMTIWHTRSVSRICNLTIICAQETETRDAVKETVDHWSYDMLKLNKHTRKEPQTIDGTDHALRTGTPTSGSNYRISGSGMSLRTPPNIYFFNMQPQIFRRGPPTREASRLRASHPNTCFVQTETQNRYSLHTCIYTYYLYIHMCIYIYIYI